MRSPDVREALELAHRYGPWLAAATYVGVSPSHLTIHCAARDAAGLAADLGLVRDWSIQAGLRWSAVHPCGVTVSLNSTDVLSEVPS